MVTPSRMALLLVLSIVSPGLAATKDNEKPDREMLRMMDFLREIELLRNMEMMQDLSYVEQVREQASGATVQKPPPGGKKETIK